MMEPLCLKSELDLFSGLPIQVAIENSDFEEVHPIATLSDGPIEFYIPGTFEHYIDPSFIFLQLAVKISKRDGSALAATDKVGPINYLLNTAFENRNALLNFPENAQKTFLKSSLFEKDTAKYFDETDPNGNNLGLKARHAVMDLNKEITLFGAMNLDLSFQHKLLLNGVSLKIRLHRAKNSFVLMSNTQGFVLKITKASLLVRKVTVSLSVVLAHNKTLENGVAKYPIRKVDVKTLTIPSGTHSTILPNLFLGPVPNRIVIGFVMNGAYSGDFTKNPFNFQNFNINYISLKIGQRVLPNRPLTPQFSEGEFYRSYVDLFSNMGRYLSSGELNITPEEFQNGLTLFAFDTTPDLCASDLHSSATQNSNISLEVKFSSALTSTINVILYSEFQSEIHIDKLRQSQDLGKDENEYHADEETRLSGVATDSAVTHHADGKSRGQAAKSNGESSAQLHEGLVERVALSRVVYGVGDEDCNDQSIDPMIPAMTTGMMDFMMSCGLRIAMRLVDGKTSRNIPQAESRGRKGRLGVSLKRQLEDGKDALDIARAATRGSQASDGAATRAGRDRFKGDMEEMDAIKKRRKAIRGTFTRIINEINGEFEKSQIDRNDIYSKFNRLESYYTKLVDLNEKYQALLVVKEGITEESIDREWQECDKYEEEKFDIQQKVKLALKSYDGSLEGWLPWWAQFSKIHENKNLSDSDRFLYLRQAIVPNSEAYRVVASYPVTGANYALAVQALQERFGDPNILTELYVRRLLNSVISNVKKENRNLSSLYDELSSHLRSLETLGIDPQLSGIFLYPLVESSLPSDILKIWHRHPSSGYGLELAKREESDKGVGGAQERLRLLLDFLKAEVRSAQRLKFVEKGFKQEEPYKRSYNDGTRTRSNFRPATVSSLFGGRTNIKCFFCERTNHASHQCRSIMKMSPGERNDKIRSAHLCFKCLRKGHIQSQCREQLECKNCGRNHLEVLCEGNSSNRLTKPGRENLKENAPEPIASLSSQACTGQVLLMTAVALLRGPNASRRVRILLDSGSQFSYIKQSLVWSIGIERKGEITIAKSLFGGNKIGEEKHGKFMLELENLGNKRDVIHIEALDQRKICDAIPPLPKGDWLEKLKIKGIILSQDNFKGKEIDILIGANYLGMILTGKIVQVEADLTAVETKLGWTLKGNSPIIDSNDNVQQTLNLLTTRCDLKDLWDLEVLGIRDPVETCSKETRYQEIKEKFITKIQRQSDQRYSVGLPWKVEKESIPSNLDIAIKRLDISTKKMTSQNKLIEYSQIFRDWLTEGLIERVEENPLERRGYYLPHRPLYKMESKTTPIRPVFDASCLGHNGLSLNQCLEKGPNLLERIPEMMIGFRENKFGVTADIRKAFQMVTIEESERNYLRFLWWEKESDRELIAYRHKRLVFGLNCSPFVMNAVIEYHLQSIRGPLVQWAKILAQSFYMDNCITSLETKQEVQEFQKAAIEIMNRAKMDLREWKYSLEENPEKGTCTKILGVVWNKMEDSLKCELPDNLSLQPKLTKRLVLSMVQRIFDPLGFCAPVFLPPKLLLQRSWGLKLGWDTPLPESMAQEFRTWLDQIKFIELIKIPRYMWNDLIFPTEVHIFCDASQIGYGAVAYLRSETGRENTLTLIWSKVRLAPMKSITIPRLELMAMVLGARLANAIQAALKRKCETTLWSDSTTALSWIKREIEWRVFVRNRVREIQATTNLNDWRLVPSQLNPADLLSRGCPPSQFVQSRWWEGPEWLKKPKEFWPNSEFSINPKEIKVEENIMKTNINLNIDYKDWILTRRSNYSLNIREKVSIEKSNATKSFKILKNTDGLWCVESKLLHGQVPEEFKTPIILPGDHPFVEQLIWEVHLKNGHVGVQFILSKLREKFWIIRGRKTIKKIISKCIACKRLKEKSLQRPMAVLPENRIGLGKPFQITGVDLLGPLHLKEGGKVWVAAFTCAVYRAIHLKLVKSLETGVFMMALHRFICRRGRPEKIYSDNGTNFAKLNRIFKRLDWTRIERETSIKRIQWIFIPPSAPWWGGFWERMVRTIKEMLIKMLGHRKLKYVQLQTALCEIESNINNRPSLMSLKTTMI
ncbi:hypothetical protein LAZ67_2003955 [Cordylochernes scorpioides]|uniref:Pro-Pol polyprotein n=1 Tax=Cordylochernes scorpioides TaxID=51811 RepID=A0ABY6K469_9ARAC|nr:hypothetical protein LAZ67_2003955 [Cordylochernes scorpioides]